MTRAITYISAGDPADVLGATEIPDPPTPGPGQIQVEVRAFPIHPGDLVGVGFGPPHPGQRTVPGLEATGVVVATGPGVDTPTPGTRVTVFPNPGSWAQNINVAAEIAVPVPDSVSDDVAAQMVCNPLTALLLYRAAQQHFSVGFDGIVINNAANSSVGLLFTASADHHQIATISVVRSADRAHELAVRYPKVPVVSTDSPDWVQQIRAIADGRPDPRGARPRRRHNRRPPDIPIVFRRNADHLIGSVASHPNAAPPTSPASRQSPSGYPQNSTLPAPTHSTRSKTRSSTSTRPEKSAR